VTGNGDFDLTGHRRDYGESALSLSPNLTVVNTSFTPADYSSLNGADTDFGSGGIMLVPPLAERNTPALAVAMGKDAVLYLLNQASLGGEQANDAGALNWKRLGSSGSGLWGGPAYYDSPSAGPLVYVQIDSDVLRGYSVSGGANPRLTQAVLGTTQAGYGGSLPIVSSNGATAGTGVLWLIRRASTVQLEAYDATHLGAPIYAAGAGTWSNPQDNPFLTPMEANGRVYVPATGTVTVFGLTP
jgi:hypothetical protein